VEPEDLVGVARYVAKLLVERRFNELEAASKGVRLKADEMQSEIDEIGLPLVLPPGSTWDELHATAIRNQPGAFSVQFDLWTTKGRSDRTVELTLYSRNGKPVIEVDDIHVP
jgi:hypothetical protein